MTHPTWPLFDLRLRTPRIELRPADEAGTVDLMLLADRGVHPADEMPFQVPWTRLEPGRRKAEGMQFYWRCWANWSPDEWHLPFATYCDGEVVGMIELIAETFPQRRVVGTGSWIGQEFQGRGFGTEQRAAVLAFAFEHLGASRANSEAWESNTASRRVSEKLGYRYNGDHIGVVDGAPKAGVKFTLDRADWERERTTNPLHVPISVDGLDTARPMFGRL